MHFLQRKICFEPRVWPTLAMAAVLALLLYLATWQHGRAAEKRALQGEFDQRVAYPPVLLDAKARNADALRYRRARVRGEWFSGGQIYLDNKTDGGTAGYHVVTPLKLSDSDTFVLVNRGWITRGSHYPLPPVAGVPTGMVEVSGIITLPTAKFLELSAQDIEGDVWQNLTIDRYRKHTHLDVLPLVLLASEAGPTAEPGLLALTEHPDAGVSRHLEYMLTWYSLSVTLVVLWIALNVSITPLDKPPPTHAGTAT